MITAQVVSSIPAATIGRLALG